MDYYIICFGITKKINGNEKNPHTILNAKNSVYNIVKQLIKIKKTGVK